MLHRLEIASKILDTRAEVLKKDLAKLGLALKIKRLWLVDAYIINKDFSQNQLQTISSILTNPVTQLSSIDSFLFPCKFDWALEIGLLPGVTDNIGNTAKELVEDLLKQRFKPNEGVFFSQLMLIRGGLNRQEVETIARQLANPLIQRVHFKNYRQFIKDKGINIIAPQVKLRKKPTVSFVNLNINDEELAKIGKLGIANSDGTRRGPLALDLTYLKTIQKYFNKLNRKPTDVELESIAQTWSEHCKHTIFADPIDNLKNGLFNTYIKAATQKIRRKKGNKDFCVSVFTDNSGAIEFDRKYLITHKVETHNSPSALDPFGGAITGIVGVNRDTIGFGLGAKPIVNTYGYCMANPNDDSPLYKKPNFGQKMLSPRKILEGVIHGVNVGGNCSGIPTPQGFVYFDKSYKGKPLVFVGTIGLIPKKNGKKKLHLKKALPGDYIVMVGGRVGIDGIHGATFSSESLNTNSPSTAVQIGDPITQKKLSDGLVKEARDLNLYHSITDNGAGGLSCSVAEMGKESGGCKVYLDKVPLKYSGLDPWQIWVSESQERMTLAVPPKKWSKFKTLMQKRGVEATIIGKFTNSRKCIVYFQKKKIMNVDMDFLHNGLPPRSMKTRKPQLKFNRPKIIPSRCLTTVFLKMLNRLNIASFAFISQQYDHEVQGSSILKPLQGKGRVNVDAIAVRPRLGSSKAVIISQGINPSYGPIDPYHMAACNIDTAIRNLVACGANPEKIALLDNFCWCSSHDPERLWQLKRAAKACYDYALVYQTPFISGKDSMFNDFNGYDEEDKPVKISILPTLLISSIGIIDDFTKVLSVDSKASHDLIYLLGETKNELGGSEYLRFWDDKDRINHLGGPVPQVKAKQNKKLYRTFYQAVRKNLISSSNSIGRGGLAIALAKMAVAGQLGFEVTLKNIGRQKIRDDFMLFSESQGRILVTVDPQKQNLFEKHFKKLPCYLIGKVKLDPKIKIYGQQNNLVINTDLEKATKNYQKTFKHF